MGSAALHSTAAHVEKVAALGGRTGSVRTLQPCPARVSDETGVKATRAPAAGRGLTSEVRGAQRALHSFVHVEKVAALGGRTGSVRTLQPCPARVSDETGVKATRAPAAGRGLTSEVRGTWRILHSPAHVQSLNGIEQTYSWSTGCPWRCAQA